MTKTAIISDVHGNREALIEVFKDMEKRGVTTIHCLGDVALKYVDPAETAEMVRDTCKIVIQGNVDDHFYRTDGIPMNKNACGKKNLEWLGNLPFSQDINVGGHRIRLLHASPRSFDRIYNPKFENRYSRYSSKLIVSPEEFFEQTEFLNPEQNQKPDIVIYGHTHMTNFEPVLDGFIMNPGSVGDPVHLVNNPDGTITETIDREISYIILDGPVDAKQKTDINVEIVRIPYKDILQRVKARVENHPLSSKMNYDRILDSYDYVVNSEYDKKENESWIMKK